jgi:hypothetical protein
MDMSYGMMLWVWLLLAPTFAAALTANLGNNVHRR